MKVAFSQKATDYLKSERAYIAQFNPRAATDIVKQIRAAVRTIAEFPDVGLALPAAAGVRRFVTPPYHLDYVVRGSAIVIVAIRHGRQVQQEPAMDDDDFDV